MSKAPPDDSISRPTNPRGAQPGNKNAEKPDSFRGWCRAYADKPETRKLLEERAATDPEFAMKLIEQGIGRPPQALDIHHSGMVEVRIVEADS